MLPQLVSEDIFEKSPAFMAVLLGENFTFTEANARYRELVGNREIIGKPLLQALPEIVDQGFLKFFKMFTEPVKLLKEKKFRSI